MIVCGIDPSLANTGLAVLTDGHPVFMHSYGEDGHKTDTTIIRNRRIRRLNRYYRDVLEPWLPSIDLLVIEGASYGSRYGNPHERGGLWHAIVAFFDAPPYKIPVAIVPPKTRAMWATGRGDADKAAVLAEARTWWPGVRIKDHDTADALVLASMGTLRLGGELPFVEKGRHRNALESAEWPKGLMVA